MKNIESNFSISCQPPPLTTSTNQKDQDLNFRLTYLAHLIKGNIHFLCRVTNAIFWSSLKEFVELDGRLKMN